MKNLENFKTAIDLAQIAADGKDNQKASKILVSFWRSLSKEEQSEISHTKEFLKFSRSDLALIVIKTPV